MRFLELRKSSASAPAYDTSMTLDALWASAAELGRITVDHGVFDGQYVEIRFSRKSGTLVYAKGYHSDIYEAFRLAIAEALELGARR